MLSEVRELVQMELTKFANTNLLEGDEDTIGGQAPEAKRPGRTACVGSDMVTSSWYRRSVWSVEMDRVT